MIIPLHSNIVIELEQLKEEIKSGIVLQPSQDKPQKGTVIAVGPGKLLPDGLRAEMSCNVGDIVYFKKYAPDEIKVDDKTYLVLSDNDVLAIC